jgi:uncharacterized membrane protein YadS
VHQAPTKQQLAQDLVPFVLLVKFAQCMDLKVMEQKFQMFLDKSDRLEEPIFIQVLAVIMELTTILTISHHLVNACNALKDTLV